MKEKLLSFSFFSFHFLFGFKTSQRVTADKIKKVLSPLNSRRRLWANVSREPNSHPPCRQHVLTALEFDQPKSYHPVPGIAKNLFTPSPLVWKKLQFFNDVKAGTVVKHPPRDSEMTNGRSIAFRSA